MRPRPDLHPPTHALRPPVAAVAVLAAALVLLVLAGPGAPPADAKARHRPCPTGGTTLLRSRSYDVLGFRVSRVGDALRVCTREPGKRRRIRALGAWSPATKLALSGTSLAWTTRGASPDGTPADTVRAISLATGKRRLTVTRAGVAPDAATPATPDTVVRLLTDDLVTVWVTAGGRLAADVADLEHVPDPDGEAPVFHAGSVYALRDVGPDRALALAKGLAFVDDSQTDDCGGTASQYLSIPAVDGFAAGGFHYFQEQVQPGPGCN